MLVLLEMPFSSKAYTTTFSTPISLAYPCNWYRYISPLPLHYNNNTVSNIATGHSTHLQYAMLLYLHKHELWASKKAQLRLAIL